MRSGEWLCFAVFVGGRLMRGGNTGIASTS